MRMSREFDATQVTVGGHLKRGFKITCGRCGGNFRVAVNASAQAHDNQESIWAARKFENEGWVIGKRGRDDRCAACVAIEVKERKAMTPVKAIIDPPKVMQREDRRIIFEKLNEVYADEATGYGSGWSDKKVAEDLNIPRAWVEQIREENFGPVKTNPEIAEGINEATKALQEAKALVAAVQEFKSQTAKMVSLIDQRLGPIQAMMDKTERSIAALEKSVG
jgi:hypothetical protein